MSVIEEVASVPTTNLAPERDFAILDRLVREKPNASVALESMILYSHNKTSSWQTIERNSLKLHENWPHQLGRSSMRDTRQ